MSPSYVISDLAKSGISLAIPGLVQDIPDLSRDIPCSTWISLQYACFVCWYLFYVVEGFRSTLREMSPSPVEHPKDDSVQQKPEDDELNMGTTTRLPWSDPGISCSWTVEELRAVIELLNSVQLILMKICTKES